MTPAQINAEMRPWTEREIARFLFRVALFERRGRRDAERLADRLALRDQQRDERRMCLECKHLQRPGSCFAAERGWLGKPTNYAPVVDLLHRCARFEFVTP